MPDSKPLQPPTDILPAKGFRTERNFGGKTPASLTESQFSNALSIDMGNDKNLSWVSGHRSRSNFSAVSHAYA